MYSISLWNKATEIGSRLKSMAYQENISQEEYDNLKNENIKLKEELEEKNNKYQSLLNEIAQKESQKPLSENEIENYYNKICFDIKSFLLFFSLIIKIILILQMKFLLMFKMKNFLKKYIN